MRIMRQKQKPFFSTLEAIELDILAGEAKKEDPPSKEVLTEPVVEPNVVRPSEAVVADSLSKVSRKTVIRIDDTPFVYIEPGTFIMGSPENEPGRGKDEMQHEVTLTRGYFIQTTLVTQEQWKEVMGGNPSKFIQGGGECPVEGVSLNDCLEFIWRINNRGSHTYRLPTEAEWEYACRAGASTSFCNGEIAKKPSRRLDPCLDAIGWYCDNSAKKTHPVMEKQPNAWGLFDMHGNVCEWCRDLYGDYPLAPQVDPQGVSLALARGCVARGGSWQSESRNCRAASRFCYSPDFRSNFVGFGWSGTRSG